MSTEPMDLSNAGLETQPWRTGKIAGADTPLEMARIAASSHSKAAMVLVRFPSGWERPNSGFADGAEELFVLEGQLELSGLTIEEGDFAFIEPRAVRSAMKAPEGCTAVVWFSDPPTWSPSDVPSTNGSGIATMPGDRAHRPERGDVPGSVRTQEGTAAGRAAKECDVLAISSRQWWFIQEGEELPSCSEPVVIRHWS